MIIKNIISWLIIFIRRVQEKSYHKKHLYLDSVIVDPAIWKKFRPEKFSFFFPEGQIIKCSIGSIHKNDFKHIVAYIGRIEHEQLKLMGENFRWLQLASHGSNGFDQKSLYKNPDIVVSRVKDVFSEPIAQYCIAAYFLFNTYSFRPDMKKALQTVKIIPEQINVIIFGLGNIGLQFAKRCKLLGWRVFGVKRTIPDKLPDGILQVFTLKETKGRLREMDYVVNLLPETEETIGFFNKDFFSRMKSDAVFCNVGRKSAVVDEDISRAVKDGVIRGAILDAHNEYDYGTPDIILTGHSSSVSSENDEKFDKFFKTQLLSFLSNNEIEGKLELR